MLPTISRGRRPWLVVGTALLVLAVGFTRLALGVHFVSDVLAGWALGAGWLAVTTAAFRGWQHDRGRHPGEPLDPLDVDPGEVPRLAPAPGSVLPSGRATVLRLTAVVAALFVLLSGSGLLVTGVLTDTWLGRTDRAVVRWLVELRSAGLTTVLETIGAFGGARTVIAVGLMLTVLGLAVAATWAPVAFVAVTLVGEVSLYFLTGQVVDRLRPAVADLTSGLPSGASWPSGHAAAAAALYGAAAALVLAYGHRRWRWAALALLVLIPVAVGVPRVYVAAHYPTDVLAGLLLGGLWVYACARLLLPAPGRGVRAGTRAGSLAAAHR